MPPLCCRQPGGAQGPRLPLQLTLLSVGSRVSVTPSASRVPLSLALWVDTLPLNQYSDQKGSPELSMLQIISLRLL